MSQKAVRVIPSVQFVELDEIMRKRNPSLFCHAGDRWPEFWVVAKQCLEDLVGAHSRDVAIVDVGAGCLKTCQALEYFRSAEYVVLITAVAHEAYERARNRVAGPWARKSLAEYQDEEYSDKRNKFYNVAKYQLDITGFTEEQAGEAFVELARRMLGS